MRPRDADHNDSMEVTERRAPLAYTSISLRSFRRNSVSWSAVVILYPSASEKTGKDFMILSRIIKNGTNESIMNITE
ncbi:MAG: hypothetical protein IJY73_04815 [Oscillospiraceae bacterium]|nr:hypothetical protein [Oscillospiraceae bacterium]